MPAVNTQEKPKQHYAIGYYNRFAQDIFDNPVTELSDIIETAQVGQAKTYNDLEELKKDLAKLGLNPKFYNASGQLLLTVQAVAPPRNF